MNHYGTLFVVATPIGNLDDAGARSIEVLRGADIIACEDTRTSGTLLARWHRRAHRRPAAQQRAAAAGLIDACAAAAMSR
jgi:16S rRNA (cytidine1402-2'-O)-methyltransferase